MEVQTINAYFTPLDYFFYLITPVIIYVAFLQWQWTKTCSNNILIMMKMSQGGVRRFLAPKIGNGIDLTMKNKEGTIETKLFIVSSVNSISVPYPGVGLIPSFLQKEIQMIILQEDDWEPALNFSEGREPIASPALLANLVNERITSFLVNFTQEVESKLKALSNMLNPTHYYIGIGVTLVLLGWIIMQIVTILSDIELIKVGLGL